MPIPLHFKKRNKNIHPPKTYTNVHRNFIHNKTNEKNPHCPSLIYSKDKQIVVYAYNGELLSSKKKRTKNTQNNLGESHKDCGK